MKIIMFDVAPVETNLIHRFAQRHSVQIKTTAKPLNLQTEKLAKGFDGLSTQTVSKDPKFYRNLAQMGIKQIALRHTGYEIVNLKAARKNGLTVTNVPGYSPRSVAEMTLTLTMYLLRHIGRIQRREARGDFRWVGNEAHEIHNLTVGVIGTGKIGSTVARVFKALGCNVLANDLKPTSSLEATVKYVPKSELIRKSDIITCHTDLNSTTQHMISAPQFEAMKNSTIFINASRGAVVNTKDLIKALDHEEIAGAGLDTVENETDTFTKDSHGKPVPNGFVRNLIKRPNVVMTPHVAFFTNNSVKNMVNIALRDTMTIVNGHRSEDQVN